MIFVLLLIVTHVVAAWFIATRLLWPSRMCDLFVICGLVAMSTFFGVPIIIGATTGFLNTATIVVSAVLPLLAAAIVYLKFPKHSYLGETLAAFRSLGALAYCLAAVILMYVLALLVVGTSLPIRAWDAASYHVIGPVRWVQSGRFIIDSFGDPFAYPYLAAAESYPNVKGILPFLVMLWSGSTAGTALAQFPYFCLLICALYALYRRLELSANLSLVATIFCITAPEVFLQTVEAYADVAYFAGVVCVVWACLATWQDKFSYANLTTTTLAFATLVGTKPTALVSCAALGFIYLVTVFVRQKAPAAKIWPRLRATGLALLSVLILSLAFAGPWYLHALFTLNNPVYPIEVSLFSKTLFEGPYPASMNSDFVSNYTKRSGFDAWWGMITEQWRPPTVASWSGGLGAAAFIVGLPCTIAYLFIVWFTKQASGTLIVLLMFLLLIITCPAIALARFFLFALALGGLGICGVAAYLHISVRGLLLVATLALCGYNVYVTIPSILYRTRPADLVAFDLVSGYARTAKEDVFPEDYGVTDFWLDQVATPQSRLAILDDTEVWAVFEPDVKPDIIRISEKPAEDFTAWLERVKQADATHVCVLRGSRYFADALASTQTLDLLYWDLHARGGRAPFMAPPLEGALFEVKK